MTILLLGAAVLIVTYCGVAQIHNWALKRRLLDIPNERSLHAAPVPKGGGLAIVTTVLVGYTAAMSIVSDLPPRLPAYIFSVLIVVGVSAIDDLFCLPVKWRLTVHIIAATLFVYAAGFVNRLELPVIGNLDLGWLWMPLTVLWIAWVTNAYNFMDGIDGIAAGQAIVAGTGWCILGWLNDQPLLGFLGFAVANANLGFLGHNWPPARIFMGDVGSAFLGFTFAALPVIGFQYNPGLLMPGILLLWPFLFDTTFTLFRRLFRKENILVAHSSHLYQRLVHIGFEHRFVTLLYIGLAVIGSILTFCWIMGSELVRLLVGLALFGLCVALWLFVVVCEHAWTRLGPVGKIHEQRTTL